MQSEIHKISDVFFNMLLVGYSGKVGQVDAMQFLMIFLYAFNGQFAEIWCRVRPDSDDFSIWFGLKVQEDQRWSNQDRFCWFFYTILIVNARNSAAVDATQMQLLFQYDFRCKFKEHRPGRRNADSDDFPKWFELKIRGEQLRPLKPDCDVFPLWCWFQGDPVSFRFLRRV